MSGGTSRTSVFNHPKRYPKKLLPDQDTDNFGHAWKPEPELSNISIGYSWAAVMSPWYRREHYLWDEIGASRSNGKGL